MKQDFLCPHCRGYLNVGESIVFTIKTKGWKGGILLLNPELGNYHYQNHESVKLEAGEHVDFHCPICDYNLMLPGKEQLARLIMRDETHKEFDVVFSRIKGERCTYKIADNIVEYYGEHSSRYLEYLNLSFIK